MSTKEEINRTISPSRLVWSEKLDEPTRKLVDALKKQRNNKVYIHQNFKVWGNIGNGEQGWYSRGFEIAIIDEKNCSFRLNTFKSVREFKLWMKGLGVKLVNLRLLSKNNKGERVYEGDLDALVVDHSHGGFWSLRDLPFFEDTPMNNPYTDEKRIVTSGFCTNHRYLVMSNGYPVWGYVQAMDGVRIIHRPNPNSEVYQPVPVNWQDRPMIF